MHFDQLAQDWQNPRTPPDERHDMTVEIFDGRKGFLAGQKLPHPEEVLAAVDELDEWEQRWLPMHKAVQLKEGLPYVPVAKNRRGSHESVLYLNDLGVVGGLGKGSRYVERPGTGFDFLDHIYHQIDLVKCITNTFMRQVGAFCVPESDPSPLGFHLVRKDGEDLTDQDTPRVRKVEQTVLNSGDERDPRKRKRLRREDMRGYVSKMLVDSLSKDACPVETQLTANGKLSGLYNVPGSSIRLCTEEGYEGDDEIFAIQLAQDQEVVAYSYADLVYDVRNPRTDFNSHGYGHSELEMMFKVLTGYYNAINFNHAGMSQNSMPRGFITVFGQYNQRAQQDFEKRMETMMRGARNRFKVPIMYVDPDETGGRAQAAQWTPMDKFDEMLFARWIVLQASLAGALYGMDPAEFHFDTFAVRSASPLNSNDIADKIAHSKSKGLEPLIRFVQNHYNQWVIPLIDDAYKLEFIGLQPEDADKKHERIMASSTVDMILEQDGREKIGGVIGNAPVNPTLAGLYLSTIDGDDGDVQPGAAGINNLNAEPPPDDQELSFEDAGADKKNARPMTKAETPEPERRAGLVILERGAA